MNPALLLKYLTIGKAIQVWLGMYNCLQYENVPISVFKFKYLTGNIMYVV